MTPIAVLVSGGGTNLQALLDAEQRGELGGGRITCVISSSATAFALQRAEAAGIETLVLCGRELGDRLDEQLAEALRKRQIKLVVLAGYLSIVGPQTLAAFEGRMLNVHPSLIPAFCGRGMHGLRVHQAALDCGVKVTGATVHLVSGEIDGGKIVRQQAVAVAENDTAQTLQRRVMEQAEWVILPKAVADYCGEIEERKA